MEKIFKAYLYIENGLWEDINTDNIAENDIKAFKVVYKETPIPHNCLFVFRKYGILYVIPMHLEETDPDCFIPIIKKAFENEESKEIEYRGTI